MLIRRIRYWLASRRRHAELRAEMELHIEEAAGGLRDQGLSESEALAEARRRFGNRSRFQEQSREVYIHRVFETAGQDIRYTLRSLAKSPVFAAVTVLTLAPIRRYSASCILSSSDLFRIRTLSSSSK